MQAKQIKLPQISYYTQENVLMMELLEHQLTVLAGTGIQLALLLQVPQRTIFLNAISSLE